MKLITYCLLACAVLLTACQSAPTMPTLMPTTQPTAVLPDPTASPTPRPSATIATSATPPPTPSATATATAVPRTIGLPLSGELPTAVGDHLNNITSFGDWQLATNNPADATIQLRYLPATEAEADNVLATWTLAVVAPFPTVADGLTLPDLQAAWHNGTLWHTPDTADLLTAVWGDPDADNPSAPPDELVTMLWAAQETPDDLVLGILPFDQLTPRLKVLRLDGQAPITPDFAPEEYPLQVALVAEGTPDAVAGFTAVWGDTWHNHDDQKITHITLSGPAGMRRAVAHRMDLYGMNYPGEETGPVLQAADIAHMSNENAFAEDCPVQDPFDSVNVCNRAEYIALMTWMGIDVNEMTGNHLNDWGTAALDYTFDLYAENGIATYGGGRDLAQAQAPLLLEHNGHNIAFVGCNPVGPEYGWATDTRPGAAPCGDYTQLLATIAELSADGYLVFVTIQEEEDYQYGAHWALRERFQEMAEAGATAVSGSHAHHPQGFALTTPGSFVHYGLGNLLADQMWSLGSRQMFLDTYTLYDGRLLNVDLWTGLNEDYARVRAMTPEERADLLRNVFAESDW